MCNYTTCLSFNPGTKLADDSSVISMSPTLKKYIGFGLCVHASIFQEPCMLGL